MIPDWHDAVKKGIQGLAQSFRSGRHEQHTPSPNTSSTAPDPAPPLPPRRSNVAAETSRKAQMPSHPPIYSSNSLSDFLDRSVETPARINPGKPVTWHIDSDEEEEPRCCPPERPEPNLRGGHPNKPIPVDHPRVTRRNEPRIPGGLTARRAPVPTSNEDVANMGPKKFKASTGIYSKPADTLSGRSALIRELTSDRRVPLTARVTLKPSAQNDFRENDHTTPSKKRKTGEFPQPGNSAASAISLDDSQPHEESEDELALSSNSRKRSSLRNGHRASSPTHAGHPSLSQASTSNGAVPQAHEQDPNSSNSDESIFTKIATQQRKFEKDRMLDSSPDRPRQLPVSQKSRYFPPSAPTARNDPAISKQVPQVNFEPESPDALQGAETRTMQELKGRIRQNLSTSLLSLVVGSETGTAIVKPPKARPKKAEKETESFELIEVVAPGVRQSSMFIVEIDRLSKELSLYLIDVVLSDEPILPSRPIRNIYRILYGPGGSHLLCLEFSRNGPGLHKMFLRFKSEHPAYEFVTLIQRLEPSVRSLGKESAFLDDALNRFQHALRVDQARAHASPSQANIKLPPRPPPELTAPSNSGQRRIRVVDRLDESSPASRHPVIISPADRRAAIQDADTIRLPLKRVARRDSTSAEDTSQSALLPRRVTRSQIDPESAKSSEQSPPKKFSQTGALGPPWTKDLIYPQPGRKAAIVPFQDLARLDDDEFLNDNLIFFFIRYLETHMEKNNPDLYKRMHFFNTYFYEALTKSPQGKKGLNYDSVSRWTKNINLFSRDFVVVPVNENLHWYVAIICNLPSLVGDDGDTGWSDNTKDLSRQEEEVEEDDDQPTAETQKSLADLTISDTEKASQTPTKKRGPGRRKPPRRSLPKYEVEKPVIITLDSLGHARSATCTQLRSYVAAEAKDKRGLEIDPAVLKGMTAKEIPVQDNFSDCGLFMCAYLEQFVADPYNFVRRILQRDANGQQWPRKIHSQDLRSRLRELILDTHKKQEKEPPKMSDPAIGSILIDRREPSPPLSPKEVQTTRQDIDDARIRFEELTAVRNDDDESVDERPSASRDPHLPPGQSNGTKEVEYSQNAKNTTHEVQSQVNSQQEEQQKATPKSTPRRDVSSATKIEVRGSPATHAHSSSRPRAYSEPGELAELMRKEKADHDSHKRRRLSKREVSESPPKSRTPSISSNFSEEALGLATYLPGIESYAAQASDTLKTSKPALKADASQMNPNPATVEMVRDSLSPDPSPIPSPSPEPEIVGARTISPVRQPGRKRKRITTPGKKLRAPETAEDVARLEATATVEAEVKGMLDREMEIAKSQDTRVGQIRDAVGKSPEWKWKKSQIQGLDEIRDHKRGDDGEMLLR